MRFFDTKLKRNWFFVFAILSVVMMVVIFLFSAQNGNESQATSDSFLEEIIAFIENIFKGSKFGTFLNDLFVAAVRRMAHCFIYALLGFFVSGMAFCLKFMDSFKKRIISAVAFCLTYAVSDEIHQIFVPLRSFEFSDIAVDFIGSVMGVLAFCVFFGIIRAIIKRKNKITR